MGKTSDTALEEDAAILALLEADMKDISTQVDCSQLQRQHKK